MSDRGEEGPHPVGTRELSEAVMAAADLFASRHWKWWDQSYPITSRDPRSLRVPDAEQIMHHVLHLVRRAASAEGYDRAGCRSGGGRLMVEVCEESCEGCDEDGLRCAQVYVQLGEVKVR